MEELAAREAGVDVKEGGAPTAGGDLLSLWRYYTAKITRARRSSAPLSRAALTRLHALPFNLLVVSCLLSGPRRRLFALGFALGWCVAGFAPLLSCPRTSAHKMTQVEGEVRFAADGLERIQAAFSFEDPDVSRAVIPAFFALLAVLAVAHAAVLFVFSLLPFHFRHYVWVAAMLCFYPAPHVTYGWLESVDSVMRDYAPFPQQRLVTQGKGLEAARDEMLRRLAGKKATQEELRRRAQENVRKRIEAEIRNLEVASNHKAVAGGAGTVGRVAAMARNLLSRAPTIERAAHVRAMKRLAVPTEQ